MDLAPNNNTIILIQPIFTFFTGKSGSTVKSPNRSSRSSTVMGPTDLRYDLSVKLSITSNRMDQTIHDVLTVDSAVDGIAFYRKKLGVGINLDDEITISYIVSVHTESGVQKYEGETLKLCGMLLLGRSPSVVFLRIRHHSVKKLHSFHADFTSAPFQISYLHPNDASTTVSINNPRVLYGVDYVGPASETGREISRYINPQYFVKKSGYSYSSTFFTDQEATINEIMRYKPKKIHWKIVFELPDGKDFIFDNAHEMIKSSEIMRLKITPNLIPYMSVLITYYIIGTEVSKTLRRTVITPCSMIQKIENSHEFNVIVEYLEKNDDIMITDTLFKIAGHDE